MSWEDDERYWWLREQSDADWIREAHQYQIHRHDPCVVEPVSPGRLTDERIARNRALVAKWTRLGSLVWMVWLAIVGSTGVIVSATTGWSATWMTFVFTVAGLTVARVVYLLGRGTLWR